MTGFFNKLLGVTDEEARKEQEQSLLARMFRGDWSIFESPQGAKIGRKLQQFPDTSIKIKPPEPTGESPAIRPLELNQKYGAKLLEFFSSLPGDIVRSYGKNLERVSTEKGARELYEGAKALPDQIKNKDLLGLVENPATQFTLDATDFLPHGLMFGLVAGGTKAVLREGGEKATKEILKKGVKESAESRLRSLLTYEDTLRSMGYAADEVARIGFEEADQIIKKVGGRAPGKVYSREATEKVLRETLDEQVDNYLLKSPEKKGIIAKLNRIFNPLKNAPENVQNIMNTWRRGVLVGRQRANEISKLFSHIPEEDGWKLIQFAEHPSPQMAENLKFNFEKYTDEIKQLRSVYDQLRKEGQKKGLDIGYIDNYLNHVWNESWEEIEAKVVSGGTRPSFVKERTIPTYGEGLSIGLNPRFTHPAQLVAHYQLQLDKAVANKRLADDLLEAGILLPQRQAPLSWKTIDAPLFPKAVTRTGQTKIVESYKAAPDVARAINNTFYSESNGLMNTAANVSRFMQELTLSGGIPTTPVNAFTLGNMIKDITAGRISSPISSFFRSFSDGASKRFFNENSRYTKMMAEEGIPLYSNIDYEKAFKNLEQSKSLKQVLGDGWNKLMNAPTFRRFMPMLEVNLFKDTYERSFRDLGEEGARRLAGDTVKNFYGVSDNFTRDKFVEDSLSALFFAPKYRESMINFWVNNVKSINPLKKSGKILVPTLQNITNPALKENRKFLVGTVLTYVLYNELNKKLTGHPLRENKGGKEFFLEVPIEKTRIENGKVVEGRSWYIPMLPSVGTLPRRALEMAGSLKEGDVAGATSRLGSFFSQPVSLASQLGSNRTFYGGQIYKKDDSALAKLFKLGGYAVEQSAHPFIGEPIAVAQGRKTPREAAMGALELPVYPSVSSDAANVSDSKIAYQMYKDLKDKDPVKARELLIEIDHNTPSLFSAIKKLAADERSGITEDEIKIRKLGVESGERAKAVWKLLEKYPKGSDERKALAKDLWDKKIITDTVYEQLVKLGKGEEI